MNFSLAPWTSRSLAPCASLPLSGLRHVLASHLPLGFAQTSDTSTSFDARRRALTFGLFGFAQTSDTSSSSARLSLAFGARLWSKIFLPVECVCRSFAPFALFDLHHFYAACVSISELPDANASRRLPPGTLLDEWRTNAFGLHTLNAAFSAHT